ncbi:MAG: VI polysaccharide biosynthesis protein [candidate division WS6 bacterium 34_10]|uniref:VI polysaccharide biosynthesis protein n=1 Tax=candidate division WS6 bacterium 34_10 TaxID=1641389 RepID=A0A101HIT2_9BACT|nr:MAG: VI polysaccharide biosynthesis protein [candidate division WS6 bacterium 34_10]
MQKVSIIGLGYVGLPLALAIEKSGKYEVVGFDISETQVKKIKDKECPITDEIAEKELKELDLHATTDEKEIKGSDYYIICVPTPVLDDYTPDYTPVKSAGETVSKYLEKGQTVVLESTVNPGTCEEILLPILEAGSGLKAGKDFNIAMCPERINPGDPKWNVYNIPRNIGSLVPEKTKEVADFYRSFLEGNINEVSSLKIAEATKIVENAFRDINIAYVNELAKSFDAMGIDLIETLKGSSNKPFSFMVHWPGRGVGGHCIAVDPYYLINRAAESGFDHKLLKMAREVNNSMPEYTVERLQEALNEVKLPINGTKIALLGLSYKEDIADLRESPCLEILEILEKKGADLLVFDPFVPDMSNVESLDEALDKCDAVIVATAHKKFGDLTEKIGKRKNVKVVVDGMNKLDKEEIEKEGKIYRGIGK